MDLQGIFYKFKYKRYVEMILYLIGVCLVTWQVSNCIKIFVDKPTTAVTDSVKSDQIPLALTFCKFFYEDFNGNFEVQRDKSGLINVTVVNNNEEINLMHGKTFKFEFVTYIEKLLICKEFELPDGIDKQQLIINKQFGGKEKDVKNLHLYIHQPGMYFLPEFGIKYPSKEFVPKEGDGALVKKFAGLKFELYDLYLNPYIKCSSTSYDPCIMKEIIKKFNKTLGCTYPIQK